MQAFFRLAYHSCPGTPPGFSPHPLGGLGYPPDERNFWLQSPHWAELPSDC
ncbi:hypothetical protein EVA_13903 [gut metagenome]|uniref:Uncharacterized protein n=1 Tax=gut metagenome TaxID=749906 RepID=J9CDE2_9ZZZZ